MYTHMIFNRWITTACICCILGVGTATATTIQKVEGPDGHVYEFQAPEGASEAKILRFAKFLHDQRQAEIAQAVQRQVGQETVAMQSATTIGKAQSQNAIGIDVGSAYGGAFMTIAILFIFAAIFFKLITFGLTRKTLDTSTKYGRWIMGWTAALSIASSGNLINNTTAEYFYRLGLVVIPLSIIGFIAGYLWKKIYKQQHTQQQNIKTDVPVNDNDEKYWAEADNELNSVNRKVGLWAKSLAESDGDEAKAKALYLKLRFGQLKNESTRSMNYQ